MNARRASRWSLRWRVVVPALLCLAPVPGDIGSCGQPPDELDAGRFFETKKAIDCLRCRECGFQTDACRRACDAGDAPPNQFLDGCFPVVHDGEVCLRKLLEVGCGDFDSFVRDDGSEVPTECNFCPLEAK